MSNLLRLGRLAPDTTALFVCDIQERFRPLIHKMPHVIQATNTALRCARVMNLPVIVTEQYPKALGKTVKELDISPYTAVEKTVFSMIVPDVEKILSGLPQVQSILITGIEGHVCIFQTSIDLLEKGYNVHILADAVSSQEQNDCSIAMERLRQSGAFITTTECAMFALMKSTAYPGFKNISAIFKDHHDELKKLHSLDADSKKSSL